MKTLSRTVESARTLAVKTPSDRNRVVDFLRAASILVVVFGHWLMAAPEMVDGELRIGHLLSTDPWTQWLTWVFQVMPVFFFVGGYSNAVAWRSARRRGVPQPQWLRDRLRRLILPVLPVVAFWIPVAGIAWNAGVEADILRVASQAALVPTWFLATYVLIVTTVPVTLHMWERFGWWAIAGTTAIAAGVDIASIGLGYEAAKWLNYVFVWNAVHMLGYAWADDRIGTVRTRLAMAASGVMALGTLVAFGPYPLAMVGIDNAPVANSNPPKVTLIALGLFQFGLAMAAEGRLRRWLSDIRWWTGVVAINGAIMSLYLWHLTVMVLVLGVSIALGGMGLSVAVSSGAWWLTRPLWLMVLLSLTMPVLGLVARFERPRRDIRPAPVAWQPVFAVILVCAGLGLLAKNGIVDADGLNGLAATLPFAGMILGRVVRSPLDSVTT
jgi:fucose 4-O-acetylase-like acetyltransferase